MYCDIKVLYLILQQDEEAEGKSQDEEEEDDKELGESVENLSDHDHVDSEPW